MYACRLLLAAGRPSQLGPVTDSIARPFIWCATLTVLVGCDGVDRAIEPLSAQLQVKVNVVRAAGGIFGRDLPEHAPAQGLLLRIVLKFINQRPQLIAQLSVNVAR